MVWVNHQLFVNRRYKYTDKLHQQYNSAHNLKYALLMYTASHIGMNNKRQLSPEEIITPSAKHHTHTKTRMDDITKRLETMLQEQRSGFTSVNTRLDDLHATVNTRINTIEKACEVNTKRLDKVENHIDRISLANELRLVGIPISNETNINELFSKIAVITGYDTSNPTFIPTVSHIMAVNKETKQFVRTGTILIQFLATHIKNEFYKKYLHKIPISLKDLGFSSDKNIIISENLTKQNAKLFKEAHQLKKLKKFASVFTSNGLVHVKINKGERSIVINDTTDLEIAAAKSIEGNIASPDMDIETIATS